MTDFELGLAHREPTHRLTKELRHPRDRPSLEEILGLLVQLTLRQEEEIITLRDQVADLEEKR